MVGWLGRLCLALTLVAPAGGLPATVLAGPAARPSTQPAAEQVLRVPVVDPRTLDPARMNAINDFGLLYLVFEGLYTLDAGGALMPAAAAALPEISPDGRRYTVRLQPGQSYSDGAPLRALEFRYSILRWLDPRLASPNAAWFFPLAGAEAYSTSRDTDAAALDALAATVGIAAPDDLTLVFTLAQPAAYFAAVLWIPVPLRRDLVEAAGERWTEPATYLGNGPFRLTSHEAQSRLVYEASPRYWRGAPRLQRIEARIVDDPTVAFLAYLNGEVDTTFLEPDTMGSVAGDPRLQAQVARTAGICAEMLFFNVTRPPLDQPAVRRAIDQAIDRDTFSRDILHGLDEPMTQLVPPGLPGYYPDLRVPPYDPAAARRTLADAGIDPAALPEIAITYPSVSSLKLQAEWLQAALHTSLGVQVVLDPLEFRALFARIGQVETFPPVLLAGYCPGYPDPQQWYTYVFRSSSTLFRTGWLNAEYDRLTGAADAELDPTRRAALYQQAAQILVDEAPAVPLAAHGFNRLVQPWVKGWQIAPFDFFFSRISLHEVYVEAH